MKLPENITINQNSFVAREFELGSISLFINIILFLKCSFKYTKV